MSLAFTGFMLSDNNQTLQRSHCHREERGLKHDNPSKLVFMDAQSASGTPCIQLWSPIYLLEQTQRSHIGVKQGPCIATFSHV